MTVASAAALYRERSWLRLDRMSYTRTEYRPTNGESR
jgi:hypothetical protein